MNQGEWLDFWFKPQLFMHESWIPMLDETLINKQSSTLAWNLSFHYICDCYQLPEEYFEIENDLTEDILHELLKSNKAIINMACLMVSSLVVDKSVSLALRRRALQRHRALSLKKRFLTNCQSLNGDEFGIYLVFLSVISTTPKLWSRFRLLFPKSAVEKIEQTGNEAPRSKANDNAIRRAWKEIFYLKNELEKNLSITSTESAIAVVDAVKTIDTQKSPVAELQYKTSASPDKENLERHHEIAS